MTREKKSPRVDFAALKEAVAEATGGEANEEETAREGGYSALRGERPVGTHGEGRKCRCCGASLSRYNDSRDDLCYPCDAAIKKWKLFPTSRSTREQEMAPHCLIYVAEKCTKGKKVRNAVGGETSGGSSGLATGRKMPKKK